MAKMDVKRIEKENKSRLLKMLSMMVKIRRVEESLNTLFAKGKLFGTCHLYVGQEAVAVGSIFPLRTEDLVASTHRGHGHALAKGVSLKKLAAELVGKAEGLCKGRGGTQHLSAIKKGFLGTNGITGGFIPIATGAAMAFKMQKKDNVVLSFFGDGASNTGYFHESLNFASIKKLPVIFICENNLYAMSVPVSESTSVKDIADRAPAYSMPGVICDGMDPLAVEDAVVPAIDRARSGQGPTLIEAKTYRYLGHSKSDMRIYRTKEEEKKWREKDPIDNLAEALVESGKADKEAVDDAIQSAEKEVDDAMEWALSLEDPEGGDAFAGLMEGRVV